MILRTIDAIGEVDNGYQHNFQIDLTKKLDELNGDFNQDLINQIVLWKVNRYAEINEDTLNLLNSINKDDISFSEDTLKKLLDKLINTKGIKLPMASSILRFKNPNLFQIIDQRVYRFIYGKELNINTLKPNNAIDLYLIYLKDLREICKKFNIDFSLSDRILYVLDKKFNKNIPIKY